MSPTPHSPDRAVLHRGTRRDALAAPRARPPRPRPRTASTPVPIVTPDGQLSSYVVNVGAGKDAWGQASPRRSTRPTAPSSRTGRRSGWSSSTPPTATSAPTSSPARRRAPSPPSARPARSRSRRARPAPPPACSDARLARGGAQGEFANTEAEDVVADPREAEQWDMKVIKADQAHQRTDGSQRRARRRARQRHRRRPPGPRRPTSTPEPRSTAPTPVGSTAPRPAGSPTTSDHGTHVAGTIAAARNGEGIVGVAPDARMASVKVVNDDGFIYPEYAICGFMWAGLEGMDVTNNSYYVDPFMYWCGDQPDQAAAMEAVNRAVQWSTGAGRGPRRGRRQRRDRPGQQHDRHRQPQRQPAGPAHASTAAASTSRPSCRAW